jgi:hypothetical protein
MNFQPVLFWLCKTKTENSIIEGKTLSFTEPKAKQLENMKNEIKTGTLLSF